MQADQDRDIERGMMLAAERPEIMPDQADARIKPIYEDIQRTLRVPFVNLIFRTLANEPDYLEAAWRQLGPVLRTRSFEREADDLRGRALMQPLLGRLEVDGIEDLDRLRAFNDSIHYVLPKLLLIVTALAEGGFGRTSGGPGRPSDGSGSDAIPLGVAQAIAKVQMVDPEKTGGLLRDLFERVKARHGHPLVSSYYRGLGNWPEFLRSAWGQIEPLVGSESYEERKRVLVESARAGVRNLPGGGTGNTDPDKNGTDDIRAILAAFRFKFIPEMLIDVTLIKAMLDGPEVATSSRFSA